jgi:hypothetical protein
MVFEDSNSLMKVDANAGHMAYVEKAVRAEGGYKVTFSQANTQYDAKGNYIAGSYINQNTTTKFVPDSANGISYIYEKS